MGDAGEPGPVYLEIPTDVLRTHVPKQLVLDEWIAVKPPRRPPPSPDAIKEAVELFWSAKRPLVITGRGARGAGQALVRLLDATGALYLDTQESRGLVPVDHPSTAAAVRAAAMTDADVVLLVGRKLDYQVGYGSPAVFPHARFIRVADNAGELIDNRRGEPELLADPALALAAMVDAAGNRESGLDKGWAEGMRKKNRERMAKASTGAKPMTGEDGKVHPRAIFDVIAELADPDYIAIADGGDLLSFARTGLQARTYMDAGAFGCLGVGVPFAIAASLAEPNRQVISVNGDGAFGINAMEIDTAVRHGAKCLFVVSNNAAWNIERLDQEMNYGGRVVGTTLRHSDYAGMARALGLHGERVEKPEELKPALERALKNMPALVDVVTSQTVLSSDASKGLGFVPDYQALTAWDEAERKRRQ
jgi:acetolactate synthase-1/2/3 large subunit